MTFRKIASTLMTGALLTAGAAFGAAAGTDQTRADISFKFRTPAGEMPAGKYNVEVRSFQGGNRYIALNNVDTKKTVMFFTQSAIEAQHNSGQPARLMFACGNNDCSLSEVWAKQSVGYKITKPRVSAAEAERLAVVTLQPTAAE